MSQWTALIVGIYGAFTLLGGNIGYRRKKSTISLVMGCIFGDILFIAGIGILKKLEWGYYLAISTSIFLIVFFAIRYLRSPDHPMMPAGLMTLLGIATLAGIYLTSGRI